MSSNQMRGRAIRVDKHTPDKAANIWHLVTVPPPERKLSFLDAADRVDILRPPFTRERVEEINRDMIARAADRRAMAAVWERALARRTAGRIREGVRAGGEVRPRLYAAGAGGAAALHGVLLGAMGAICLSSPPAAAYALLLPLMGVSACSLTGDLRRSLGNVSSEKAVKRLGSSLLQTLRETGAIESPEARLCVEGHEKGVECALEDASLREKNLFAEAMGELLSPPDNPRYLLVRTLPLLGLKIRMPSQCCACPTVLGVKKETAELFRRTLEKSGDRFELVYTRSEEGRKTLLECRRAAAQRRTDVKVTRSRTLGRA